MEIIQIQSSVYTRGYNRSVAECITSFTYICRIRIRIRIRNRIGMKVNQKKKNKQVSCRERFQRESLISLKDLVGNFPIYTNVFCVLRENRDIIMFILRVRRRGSFTYSCIDLKMASRLNAPKRQCLSCEKLRYKRWRSAENKSLIHSLTRIPHVYFAPHFQP